MEEISSSKEYFFRKERKGKQKTDADESKR